MKERLDVLLVKRGLAESREKAKAIIMSGIVYVEDQKEDKAGTTFDENAKIEVRGSTLKYVSRGGLKLEKAMTHFGVTLDQKVCMDVGASTGGFTDCMLQNGAVKVFSVDVGHGQLAWKLRNDPRVVCMEKTNIRYVTPEDIGKPVDFSSIDVSFISLTKVLGPVKEILSPGGEVVALIKPQFEAGREKVGKKGVVREKSTHLEVIQMVMAYAAEIGFEIRNLEFSPIKGPERYYQYFKQFGLLGKTGIDLPGEAGTIMHQPDQIGPVELATVSFGQSFQITPIQLITTASSLINGGTRITPHIGIRAVRADGQAVHVFAYPKGERILSEQTSETLRYILEQVVAEGSGKNARIEGYRIGGKTATSEKLPRSRKKYISSFLGFAPADDPQVIALITIDEPEGIYYGGTIAAPVIRDLFEVILPYLGVEKRG